MGTPDTTGSLPHRQLKLLKVAVQRASADAVFTCDLRFRDARGGLRADITDLRIWERLLTPGVLARDLFSDRDALGLTVMSQDIGDGSGARPVVRSERPCPRRVSVHSTRRMR